MCFEFYWLTDTLRPARHSTAQPDTEQWNMYDDSENIEIWRR